MNRSISFYLIMLLVVAGNASAQGLIIPDQPDAVISLTDHRVNINVIDQVADVRVTQIFHNDSKRPIEGSFLFPLPKNASVSNFEMHADGKVLKGKILKEDEARRIYEDIVRRQLDPALLEYIDHQLFQVRIFPIPAGRDRRIELRFASILPREGNMIRLSLPLQGKPGTPGRRVPPPDIPVPMDRRRENHPASYGPLRTRRLINVSIRTKQALKSIYSPTHDVAIQQPNNYQATISCETSQVSTGKAFVLYYGVSRDDVGISLLTFRPNQDEDGYFLMLLSPGQLSDKSKILPRDILFVLDVSGSMQGEKINQAKLALTQCVKKLNANDRFNIIAFSTSTERFQNSLVDATGYRDKALKFIDKLDAKGGTNIHKAMLDALASISSSEHSPGIIFLTDGLPTVGETDIKSIIDAVQAKNTQRTKLFTFGVGYDVNTLLLDKIAAGSCGHSDYIEPDEPIDKKVTAFFNSIQYPALTQLAIDYGSIKVSDVYPVTIPDLFHGSQVTILGRFRNPHKTTIRLTGHYNGQLKTYSTETDWTPLHNENAFLPHLWATRKIGYLTESIRLNGENRELVDEIVRLSRKYGVMSPYTSYLAEEEPAVADQSMLAPAPSRQRKGVPNGFHAVPLMKSTTAAADMAGSAVPSTGRMAVKRSKAEREMKEAIAVPEKQATVCHIGSRTFYRQHDMWVDSEFRDQLTIDVKYGSNAYFQLLREFPELGKFFAIGERVIVKWNNRFIRIDKTGKETLSTKDIRLLK